MPDIAFYMDTETMEWPRFPGDIRGQHPEWEEGQPLPASWVAVTLTPMPLAGEWETPVWSSPVQVGAEWRVAWDVVVTPLEEREKILARRSMEAAAAMLGMTPDDLRSLVLSTES